MKIKNQNVQKKCAIRRKLKFQGYKNCSDAAKIDGKFKYLEEKKIIVDELEEFVKNKAILKTQ